MRRLIINFIYHEKMVTLVNIYALNNEKDRADFFTKLIAWKNKNSINLDNVVLFGDSVAK